MCVSTSIGSRFKVQGSGFRVPGSRFGLRSQSSRLRPYCYDTAMKLRRLAVLACVGVLLAAADDTTARVRAWRSEHEREILHELFDFLAIPNVASNKADIQRNAAALTRMFERRRFAPETIPTAGSPVVVAERRLPN